MNRSRVSVTTAVALWAALSGPAAAQGPTLTLEQVERRFPRMSPIHIEKCDKRKDGLYDTGELACVRSIYSVMYLGD